MSVIHIATDHSDDYLVPGPGPAYPDLATERDREGVLHYGPGPSDHGWWLVDGNWFVDRKETGQILVRAKRLDGGTDIRFFDVVGARELDVIPATTEQVAADFAAGFLIYVPRYVLNITEAGWREVPTGTAIRHAGCYGFQVDGKSFSYTVVVMLAF